MWAYTAILLMRIISADNREHLACELINQSIKLHLIPNNFSVKPEYQ